MTEAAADASPRLRARIAGGLYLATTACGVFAMLVRGGMIVHGDAAATAAKIMAAQPMFRASAVADVVAGACYVGVTAILYGLLRPVSRTMSLAAALFSLAGCAVGAAATALVLAPVILLSGEPWLAAFRPDQLQALALAALRLHTQGYTISMVFFGVYCLLLGSLTYRSAYFPRVIGVLLAIAGLAWLTDSLAYLLAPALDATLSMVTEPLGFIGEASLALWLALYGVIPPKPTGHASAPQTVAA